MPVKKSIPKKLENSTNKIANVVDFLLTEEGHTDWELDEIHLTPKTANTNGKVVCKYVEENGKWVLKCTKG